MRYKDIKVVEARIDYHYGLDPELMVYRHKIGDIYGKKNLKVPHAKYSTSKKVKNLIQSLNKRDFKKYTLGGCIFFKKGENLCLKIEKI